MLTINKLPDDNARAFALRTLTENIVSLEFEPGMAVSENELSAELNISRTPIREALIELSKNGLVNIIPHKGSYISKISCSAIEEARFIRIALETAVVKLACADLPPQFVIKLNANIADQKKAIEDNNLLTLLELDNNFHKLLFTAVNKTWTYEFACTQIIHFDRLRTLLIKELKNRQTVEDHENILRAIENHDKVLAEQLMIQHLSRTKIKKDELISKYPNYFEI